MKQDLIEKIKALLRLGNVSHGATEHEAKLAMAKAQELMQKHDIAMSAISDIYQEPIMRKDYKFENARFANTCNTLIINVLKKFYAIEVVIGYMPENNDLQDYGKRYMFFGKPDKVELSLYAFNYLRQTWRQSWQEHRNKTGAGAKLKKSYYFGVYRGMLAALDEAQKREQANHSTEILEKYWLTVQNDQVALQKHLENLFSKMRKGNAMKASIDKETFDAGFERGKDMSVHSGLGAGNRNLALTN